MAPFAIAALAIAGTIISFTAACQDSPPSPTPSESEPASQAMIDPANENNPGIFDDWIFSGQSAAFSGPAQALGQKMSTGIQAAFHEQNQKGGVHGRMLELTTLDHYVVRRFHKSCVTSFSSFLRKQETRKRSMKAHFEAENSQFLDSRLRGNDEKSGRRKL